MLVNRSMPSSTVIPMLSYPDVREAADWLCRTFGFTVRLRIADHRIQLNVGDGAIVIASGVAGSAALMVRVENADRHHEHARQQGAVTLAPPTSYPYGERQYTATDLAGYRWTFSQSIADVDPVDWGGTPEQL